MGNILRTNQSGCDFNLSMNSKSLTPVNEFKFMEPFLEDSTNGLILDNFYIPEEVLANILSYVPPKNLLKLTLVCKNWCNIIKSENFWMNVYNRHYNTKAKKLPWYVFYCYFTTNNFDNLLKNGNGQERFKYWRIVKNFGDEFTIEDPPGGADPLPAGIPDFNGHTSCFATSYYDCNKIQEIILTNKRLLRYILNNFKPHIYASEWTAGRFDCGCIYKLAFTGHDVYYQQNNEFGNFDDDSNDSIEERSNHALFSQTATALVQQWEGKAWKKVEIIVEEYPPNVTILCFQHEGRDTQFWKGHYGSKMAGGVVKILFDSIQPLPNKYT